MRGPQRVAAVRAQIPPKPWTTMPPAKSWKPRSASQPPPQAQCTTSGYDTPQMKNANLRARHKKGHAMEQRRDLAEWRREDRPGYSAVAESYTGTEWRMRWSFAVCGLRLRRFLLQLRVQFVLSRVGFA